MSLPELALCSVHARFHLAGLYASTEAHIEIQRYLLIVISIHIHVLWSGSLIILAWPSSMLVVFPTGLSSEAQRKGGDMVNDFSKAKLALLLHERWLCIKTQTVA